MKNQHHQNFFDTQAFEIHKKHRNQTPEDVINLTNKYLHKKIFKTPIKIWDAIEKLGMVSDPTDKELYSTSQFIHTLQVIEGMEKDKIINENLIVSGWIHDLGKALLLTDELPENIVCDNYVISGEDRCGLDNCIMQWNHDEFIFIKFKELMPSDYLWLIRYHSINVKSCEKYFSDEDRIKVDKLLMPFKKWDKETKSIFNLPKIDIDKHQKILEKYFPKEISI